MINNPTAITKYKIQENVSEYPIGFEYSDNADSTPQLAVTINGSDATYGEHWVLSLDRKSVIILVEEQVGARLTIRRAIPLVQESDYQIGRIDPEQIEADFDASVERDQMLDEHIEALKERVRRDEEDIEKNRQDIEALQDEQLEQDAKIAKNTSDISVIKTDVTKAQSTADEALSTAKKGVADAGAAQATADEAKAIAETKQPAGDYATNAALKSAITSERAISDGKYLPISDSKAFALKSALDSVSAQVDINRHDISDCKGDIAALEIDKQDKLIAGDHVKIEDNVISTDGPGLPDQAGHTGYLTTDGTNTKWSDKDPLVNSATQSTSLGVLNNSVTGSNSIGILGRALKDNGISLLGSVVSGAEGGISIGANSVTHTIDSVAIGRFATVGSSSTNGWNGVAIGRGSYVYENYGIAIGWSAHVEYGANSGIQLGSGANKESYTFNVGFGSTGNYKMLDHNAGGLIPSARFALEGEDGQVLVKNGDFAEWKEVGGDSGLPDQEGHTGYLMTDGENATWSDKEPLVNNTSQQSIAVGIRASATGNNAVVFGIEASASDGGGVAVGYLAKALAPGAIQLGFGTNTEEDSLYVSFGHGVLTRRENYKLLDKDGHIPDERLPQLGDINTALAAILGTEV